MCGTEYIGLMFTEAEKNKGTQTQTLTARMTILTAQNIQHTLGKQAHARPQPSNYTFAIKRFSWLIYVSVLEVTFHIGLESISSF